MAIEPPPTAPTDSRAEGQARARAAAEAQGVVLDGKAFERAFEAGKGCLPSPEEREAFIELLRQLRKQP